MLNCSIEIETLEYHSMMMIGDGNVVDDDNVVMMFVVMSCVIYGCSCCIVRGVLLDVSQA